MKYDLDKDDDIVKFMDFLYSCSSYDELKAKCDMSLIECTISKAEFDSIHAAHHKLDEHKMTVL